MVYTFDIFDTLITRTTAQPEGIFMIMQEMLDRDDRFTKLPSHFKRHFRDFRMDAESEAHRRAANMGREDVTLEMIYAQMAYMNYLPRETVQWLMELELAAEAENSIPIPDNINRLKSLKEENEIYLLSDMYLPGEHIRQMLVAADGVFRDIPILVSGEIGKNKSSGKLYAYFLEKYGIDSRKWVHIGDNPKSDGVMAVRAGGRSELYSGYGFTEFERRLLKEQGNQYAVQFTLGMVRKVKGDKRESTRAEQVGMSVGGPVLFGYVLWVLQEALRQGIQTLFFVARDGDLLKKMADLIIRSRKMALQTRYLYGSRYVWRIAAAAADRDRFRDWVQKYASFSTLAELVEELHLEAEELADYFPKLLQADGRVLSAREKLLIKEILKTEESLFRTVALKQSKDRAEAVAYLRQELASAEGRAAFVELNGTGRSQCSMQALIADFYKEPVISFFYAMTNAVDIQTDNNVFYKYTYKRLRIDTVIEMLTRAPHGQTIGYREENGRWNPVLDASAREYPEEQVYEEYIKGVLAFTREACGHCRCPGEKLSEVSLMYAEHICSEPEPEVQKLIGDIPSSEEGTGTGTKLYGPELTDGQLRQIFLYHVPVQECYPGIRLDFSLLRLTPEQKKTMAYYQMLNPAGQVPAGKKSRDDTLEITGKIVLYGAGKRGQDLYREIRKNENACVVLWVDKNYKNCGHREMEISPPDRILEVSYDYLWIGVADLEIVKGIREDLISLGVPAVKILWN